MRSTILFFGLFFLISSCQKESLEEGIAQDDFVNQQSDSRFPNVDGRLWIYFERFEREAANRGIDIDLSEANLIGVIEPIEESNVAGRCNYHSQNPNRVTIDRQFWERGNDLYREAVVFHELGHCQLLRDHREAQSNAGHCLSLMASGVGSCQTIFTSQTRDAYLDELFDPAFAGDWFD